MAKSAWTTKKPAKSGWYWVKIPHQEIITAKTFVSDGLLWVSDKVNFMPVEYYDNKAR